MFAEEGAAGFGRDGPVLLELLLGGDALLLGLDLFAGLVPVGGRGGVPIVVGVLADEDRAAVGVDDGGVAGAAAVPAGGEAAVLVVSDPVEFDGGETASEPE